MKASNFNPSTFKPETFKPKHFLWSFKGGIATISLDNPEQKTHLHLKVTRNCAMCFVIYVM